MIQFFNNVSMSLLSSCGQADTSITVHDASALADLDSGNSTLVKIDNEYLTVTAANVGTGVLTVTRGSESSTALPHGANASVIAVVTAGSLVDYIAQHAGGITDIVEDTSPQLGGDLDTNGHTIDGVTATELGYVSGVTDSIQDQLDAKAQSGWIGANDGIAPLDSAGKVPVANLPTVTASKALVSDGSGNVAASAVTATELGYVLGVTSAVQTQINAKAATSALGTAATKNVGNGASLIPISDENGQTGIGGVWSLAGNGDLNTSGSLRISSGGGTITARSKMNIGSTGEIAANANLLTLQGATSQSGNYLRVVDSSNTLLAYIDSYGGINTTGSVSANGFYFASGGDLRLLRNGASELMVENGGGGAAAIIVGNCSAGQLIVTPIQNGNVACIIHANSSGQDALQITSAGGGQNLFTVGNGGALSGAGIDAVYTEINAKLVKTNNLSDLNNASTARTNLGLGAAAEQSNEFFAQVSNNLSDLASASTARSNLGLGSASVAATSDFASNAENGANAAAAAAAAAIPTAITAKFASAVADGTYTVGLGISVNGTITISGGIITAIQQAS